MVSRLHLPNTASVIVAHGNRKMVCGSTDSVRLTRPMHDAHRRPCGATPNEGECVYQPTALWGRKTGSVSMTATEPSANAPHRMRMIAMTVAAVGVLALIGLVAAYIHSGGSLVNEMACSAGEAPANNAQGGDACFKGGSDLPRGYTWDPRGNYKVT